MNIFLELLGFIFIWAAVGHNRKGESKFKFLSRSWWAIMAYLTIGLILIIRYGE